MASNPLNDAFKVPTLSPPAKSAFRLDDDPAIDSDTSQSASSVHSLSQQSPKPVSKQKRKKNRRQVGALTENLEFLLSQAFSATRDVSQTSATTADQGTQSTADVPALSNPRAAAVKQGTSRRTRDNMEKAKKRQTERARRFAIHEGIDPANMRLEDIIALMNTKNAGKATSHGPNHKIHKRAAGSKAEVSRARKARQKAKRATRKYDVAAEVMEVD